MAKLTITVQKKPTMTPSQFNTKVNNLKSTPMKKNPFTTKIASTNNGAKKKS